MRIITNLIICAVTVAFAGCKNKLSEEEYTKKTEALDKSRKELKTVGGMNQEEIASALFKHSEGRAHLLKIKEAELAALKFLDAELGKKSKKGEGAEGKK